MFSLKNLILLRIYSMNKKCRPARTSLFVDLNPDRPLSTDWEGFGFPHCDCGVEGRSCTADGSPLVVPVGVLFTTCRCVPNYRFSVIPTEPSKLITALASWENTTERLPHRGVNTYCSTPGKAVKTESDWWEWINLSDGLGPALCGVTVMCAPWVMWYDARWPDQWLSLTPRSVSKGLLINGV